LSRHRPRPKTAIISERLKQMLAVEPFDAAAESLDTPHTHRKTLMRHTIQSALVFDNSQPEFLLIEYAGDGVGRLCGQFHTLKDALEAAHSRAGVRETLTVAAGRRPARATPPEDAA